jgi:hypothetical protein
MRIQDVSHTIWTLQATETVYRIKLEATILRKYVFVEVSAVGAIYLNLNLFMIRKSNYRLTP